MRIYTPKTGKAPYPVIVYYHGGGFVIATIDTYDASARGLANGAEAVVVALEYRKAPENKFPAAHDDALAAYEWTLKNAASFAGNAKKIALVGESAGGNLAASVSMAARDKKEQVPLYQVLVYPIAGSDMNTESYRENANAKPLNKAMMAWFAEKYFDKPDDAKDPRIELVHANLANLPATTIINAQIDPLRSDGELLAEQLRVAHVPVEQTTLLRGDARIFRHERGGRESQRRNADGDQQFEASIQRRADRANASEAEIVVAREDRGRSVRFLRMRSMRVGNCSSGRAPVPQCCIKAQQHARRGAKSQPLHRDTAKSDSSSWARLVQ